MTLGTAFRFTSPAWVKAKDIYDAVLKKIAKDDIYGIQDYGHNRWEVCVSEKSQAEIFLNEGLDIGENGVSVFIYKDKRKWIRVKGMPLAERDADLEEYMRKYGKVYKVVQEAYEWDPGLATGIRRVLMEVETEIPDVIMIHGARCLVQGPGVVRACYKCLKIGHTKENCGTEKQVRAQSTNQDKEKSGKKATAPTKIIERKPVKISEESQTKEEKRKRERNSTSSDEKNDLDLSGCDMDQLLDIVHPKTDSRVEIKHQKPPQKTKKIKGKIECGKTGSTSLQSSGISEG